jgi:hypothetical protein
MRTVSKLTLKVPYITPPFVPEEPSSIVHVGGIHICLATRIAKPSVMVCALFTRKAPELGGIVVRHMRTRSTRVANFQPNIPKDLVLLLEVESGSNAHK